MEIKSEVSGEMRKSFLGERTQIQTIKGYLASSYKVEAFPNALIKKSR